jgi:NAD(P)-dependent dehydrogenase (short-subunit alcohol dehydrogenase family)
MTIFDLQNRVAFITGGNGGIGLGMARGFASAGAAVVIAGRNKTVNTRGTLSPPLKPLNIDIFSKSQIKM